MGLFKKKHRLGLKPTTAIVLGFIVVILIGALLLSLPISARSGESTPFLTSLFTATSATCVTGLVLVDTHTHWTGFGQIVILLLIQIGGLGFMSVATLLSLFVGRTITMRERLVMTTSLNVEDMEGIVRLTRNLLLGTLFFELIGAVVLSIRFSFDFGVIEGIKKGIFHSVSAFCNAGFDLMGSEAPFSSMTAYSGDIIVNTTLMSLIIVGGLGFFVWSDIWQNRGKKFACLKIHTKITLIMTLCLIIGGLILFLGFEHDNPNTLGPMSPAEKTLSALFQSVTTRTAGFNSIDQGAMTEQSVALTVILMLIGGSPGSTAGGIKTVTTAVLVITAIRTLSGKNDLVVYKRSIPMRAVMNAFSLLFVAIVLVMTGAFILVTNDGVTFMQALYESASAFGTAGLSMGITSNLGTVSQVTLIVLMYLGRIGVLTLGLGVLMRNHTEPSIKYVETKILVG